MYTWETVKPCVEAHDAVHMMLLHHRDMNRISRR